MGLISTSSASSYSLSSDSVLLLVSTAAMLAKVLGDCRTEGDAAAIFFPFLVAGEVIANSRPPCRNLCNTSSKGSSGSKNLPVRYSGLPMIAVLVKSSSATVCNFFAKISAENALCSSRML